MRLQGGHERRERVGQQDVVVEEDLDVAAGRTLPQAPEVQFGVAETVVVIAHPRVVDARDDGLEPPVGRVVAHEDLDVGARLLAGARDGGQQVLRLEGRDDDADEGISDGLRAHTRVIGIGAARLKGESHAARSASAAAGLSRLCAAATSAQRRSCRSAGAQTRRTSALRVARSGERSSALVTASVMAPMSAGELVTASLSHAEAGAPGSVTVAAPAPAAISARRSNLSVASSATTTSHSPASWAKSRSQLSGASSSAAGSRSAASAATIGSATVGNSRSRSPAANGTSASSSRAHAAWS